MGTPRIAYGGTALFLGTLFLAAQAWVVVLPGLDVPAGTVDLGIPFLPTDHAQYQMVAQQARYGGGVFHENLYTTESQDGRFLMLGLTAVGWLQRLVPLPDKLAWNGLRLVAVAALALVLWFLCWALFLHRGRALIAFAALLFAGGLDAVARGLAGAGVLGQYTPDSWMANPWNFSLFWTSVVATWVWPLGVIASMVLLEVRYPIELTAVKGGNTDQNSRRIMGRSLLRGLAFALLWMVHPYSAMAWGVLVAWASLVPVPGQGPLFIRILERVRFSLPAILGPLLVLVYILWSRQDPVYAASSDQVRLWHLWYLPHLWLPAYGPQILLSFVGLLPERLMGGDREGNDGFAWIKAWALVALVLSCNPVVTGAKFQFLAIVPLGLLAARGAFLAWDRFVPSHPRPWIPALASLIAIAVLSTSSVSGLIADIRDEPNREASRTTEAEVTALAALRELPEGGVLCHPGTGLLVPWKAGKPVFVGHWFLSTRYQEKAFLVKWFHDGHALQDQRRSFLRHAGIRWILHGPREAAFGPVPDLEGLVQTWNSGDWSIFEFIDSRAP